MTKLSKLHARLKRLKRRRRNLRWGTGYCGFAVAVLWVLVAAFLFDWLFAMTVVQRLVLMAISVGVLVWAFRRYTLPWLGRKESELDVALMVERQTHIDTDIVAALQFESPEAPAWGSVQLEEAVIEHTAQISPRLEVTQGIPKEPLNHRMIALVVTSIVLAVAIGLYPDYAATFLRRLLLGSQHYPTRTVIETVKVNGREVLPDAGPHPVVEGQPVKWEVTCSGEIPEAGRVDLELLQGGGSTTIPLQPAEGGPAQGEFSGTLQRLADRVQYQIYLGDAWTDPVELVMVPLPTIELDMEVTPPDYATGPEVPSGTFKGMRQIAVVEGSQVQVRISADKVLRSAALSVEGEAFAMRHVQGEQADATGDNWALDPVGSPLEAVVQPVRFAVQVTDEHGLELEKPVQGVVRIKADRPPRVTASLRTAYILPGARPRVLYRVEDDYGVARVSILRQVVHDDGTTQEDEVPLFQPGPNQKPPRTVPEESPLAPGEKPSTMRPDKVARLDLSTLKLAKGDQLRVTVQAVDYRGPREGKIGLSEPLVFQVTDEQGILAAITEADRQLIGEYKEMIERQINVGEKP